MLAATDPNLFHLDWDRTFVGDAEHEEEQQLLDDAAIRPLLDSDFLKVGHHGSDTSSTAAFLDAVTPKVCAISCGEPEVGTNVTYRHPRLSTVQALLGRAGPRGSAPVTLRAFDKASGTWRTVTLSTAVHATPVEADLVFGSDGQRIELR